MSQIALKTCTIAFLPWGAETTFPDGTKAPATPHDTHHYHVLAHRLGYGDDILRFCQEHDFAHSYLMERLTDSPSDVLWQIAHGKQPNPMHALFEEVLCQSFQAFLRANQRPIIGDVRWDDLKSEALRLLDGACTTETI